MDEARLSAAVGRNAEYYLPRWREMRSKGSSISWNWPACLLSVYWFAWRKMWVPLAVLIGAFLVIGLIGATDPAFARFGLLINIGLTFVTGALGNHIYRRHCERLVASTAGQDEPAALAALRERGGTSNVALYATIGASVLLVFISVAGQMAEMQRAAEEAEARNRVDAIFNQAYEDSGQSQDPLADGDKPAEDEYYPEGE